MTRRAVPVAIFHPAFHGLGGAEVLAATQAAALERTGVDVCVVTLGFDAAKWSRWFERVPVRVVEPLPLVERLCTRPTRLQRVQRLVDRCLADRRVVLAINAPCQVLIASSAA